MPYLPASYYSSRYASPYWSSAYYNDYPYTASPYAASPYRSSYVDSLYDPYYTPSYAYRSPYYTSPYSSRYVSPYYAGYRGFSSYSAWADATRYVAPTSTVTYSSPYKTEVVTESPGKREVTTYDNSPISTAYTYASPARSVSYVDYDYTYPRYSPSYYSPYRSTYVSPYTGNLIAY
jgi:hypothetical protein